MAQKLLIVELDARGHRLAYVRHLIQWAPEGAEIVLALPAEEAARIDESVHLGALERRYEKVFLSGATSWSKVVHLAVAIDAQLTIVPDGDRWLAGISRRPWRAGRLSVLLMRDPWQKPIEPKLSDSVRRLAKRALVRFLRLRGVAVSTLSSATARTASRATPTVRDPIEISTDGSVPPWRTPDRYWFGIFGAITGRKNVGLVAEALSRLERTKRVGLVVAGRIDETVRDELSEAEGLLRRAAIPLVMIDRILSDTELDTYVAAADCVVVAHSNEGPSGLLGRAAALGTRVLAAGAASLRRDAAEVPSIATWVPLSVPDLVAGLEQAAHQKRPAKVDVGSPQDFAERLLGLRAPD